MDRASTLLSQAPPWARCALSEERVLPISGDVAALVYEASAWRDGQTEPFTALMSSTHRIAC